MTSVRHTVPITGRRCGPCGFDFTGDLAACVQDAERFPATLAEVLAAADSATVRHRTEPHVWSLIEYGAHTAEAVRWYLDRIGQVLQEDRPQLSPIDWDEQAELGEYRRRSVRRVCDDATAACAELATMINSLSADQLGREGIGSDGSPRTVEILIARADHELVHHEHDLQLVSRRLPRG
ncbi:DinB family protein [Microlunatus elymi]|uniref:DinB family protein n=1 Tax=Microlunatus elymi TaxID=2596828 RepID=A0A516Q072_9ACTN|nr:DinB family protein [Microlunatus elymi]QDP96820.1 DinB family protein [Microlunatus elymi]